MATSTTGNSCETNRLLQRIAEGDQQSWHLLLAQHLERLRRIVALRLDRRLQGRLDSSDVIQEAYLEATTRLADYLREPTMSFYLWLRFLVGQKLVTLHRHHFGVQMRDLGRELPCTVAPCRKPPRPRWRPGCWATTRDRARRPSGQK
jgi:RNA polymerase sigma-70 factor (ECF subfamily)